MIEKLLINTHHTDLSPDEVPQMPDSGNQRIAASAARESFSSSLASHLQLWPAYAGEPPQNPNPSNQKRQKERRSSIEELERAMYDNPCYLGRSLGELNKALNLPAVGGVSN
jgi:hypothetical protein